MGAIRKFFRDLFTEPNNATFCLIRVLTASGFGSGFGLQFWDTVILAHPFHFPDFMTGFGVGIAAAGTAIGVKSLGKGDADK